MPFYQDTTHPDYDIAMELLCTLSMHEHPVDLLVNDMGLQNQQEIRGLAANLVGRKFKVEINRNEQLKCNTISIHPSGFAVAQSKGQEYWDRVYG